MPEEGAAVMKALIRRWIKSELLTVENQARAELFQVVSQLERRIETLERKIPMVTLTKGERRKWRELYE